MAKKILIVDDEPSILDSLSGVLRDEGYTVATANNGTEALSRVQQDSYDAMLLDVWLPDIDGLEVLKQIKSIDPDLSIVVMSGHGTIETAVKATKLGAFDFLEKPISLERLLVMIQNALHARALEKKSRGLTAERPPLRPLLGESKQIRAIRSLIDQVAPTTSTLLVTGENGTGKELIARHVHAQSPRSQQPLIETNCAAIPEELIESELFGHEKGAFTGAIQTRKGKFELADGGTLFLDEVGDLSARAQSKLLRALQEKRFERVGGSVTQSVDVRLIAATNRELKHEIEIGKFREDLFYRLNVIPIQLPPLRERQEDIELLAKSFLAEFSKEYGKPQRQLSPSALVYLRAYAWPGNIRELRNTMERLTILQLGATPIEADEMRRVLGALDATETDADAGASSPLKAAATLRSLKDARADFERDWILRVLAEQDGNVSKAAVVLGIERTHLYRKLKAYGIQ